jgi:maltose alpha-D-glucosyltransferase/alpha-amylase
VDAKTADVLDATWYKDAIIYQLHVKSFFDTKGFGIGDFAGLTQKLGYLESLGITALWLLPFYPSPLRDDGYDISNYLDINPTYGTMADFKFFLDEAHKRGIRVITEIVLNHTSDQHDWFKKSRAAKPGSFWRNFYVWSTTKERYRDARIIFKDFETSNWTWDTVANAFYWHRFYAHQPDLNFENPHVHKMLFKIIDFWLALGVDGLRLDAVPYLYEQDGTNCENLPQTFEFLRTLRAHVDGKFPGRMLLAEANQWPEDAVAYFGNGDICHMAFNFPLMPRMFMALKMEDRFPIIDILEQTPPIPENAQWAVFLRNHDELTLEMVSEEERDFMYRSYARDRSSRINLGIRRRLAPLLQNSRRRIELLNILLMSMPGTPVIYYGDEIGMGDNHFLGDRDGVRTPMQWSSDRNAGFSHVNPQQLFQPVIIDPEYHYQTVNVENEEHNLSSLLWWMRRTIALRRRYPAFARGSLDMVKSGNASVLSFVRKYDGVTVLVVVSLSHYNQPVSLDLSAFAGNIPIDIFSGKDFPRISAAPYQMTLGPYDFFWMDLRQDIHADPKTQSYTLPNFTVAKHWLEIFEGAQGRRLVSDILPKYLQQRTTAGCRQKNIAQTMITDRIIVRREAFTAVAVIVSVRFSDGEADVIVLPLTMETEEKVGPVIGEDKGLILGLVSGKEAGMVYDCAYHPLFLETVLDFVKNHRAIRGGKGLLVGIPEGPKTHEPQIEALTAHLIKAGSRNTSAELGEKVYVKLFRHIEDGTHPEIELLDKLSGESHDVVPSFIGSLSYQTDGNISFSLGFCSAFFRHSRTLYNLAIDAVTQYLEETFAEGIEKPIVAENAPHTVVPALPAMAAVPAILVLFDKKVALVGELTAKMHRLLAAGKEESFRIEPYTAFYQRSLHQSIRNLTHRLFSRIEAFKGTFPKTLVDKFRELPLENEILGFFLPALNSKLSTVRMRIHGDYRLDKIMVMDEKYRISDFEGMPSLPLSERRFKRSPLQDIASMVHSLNSTAHYALLKNVHIQEKDREALLPQMRQWAQTMENVFVESYFTAMQGSGLTAPTLDETKKLLSVYILERGLDGLNNSLESGEQTLTIALHTLFHYIEKLRNKPG